MFCDDYTQGLIMKLLKNPNYRRFTFESLRHMLNYDLRQKGGTAVATVGRNKLWEHLRQLEADGAIKIERRGHGYWFKVLDDNQTKEGKK